MLGSRSTPATTARTEAAGTNSRPTVSGSIVMDESALIALAATAFGWAILSGWFDRHDITGPMVFLVGGLVLANPSWGIVDVNLANSTVHDTAEITLALLLFADASTVSLTARPPRRAVDRSSPRHRAASVDRCRDRACRPAVPGVALRTDRAHRHLPRAHRCRVECIGDLRYPPTRPGPARAQRRERTERRHRHTVGDLGHRRVRHVRWAWSTSSSRTGSVRSAELAIGVGVGVGIGLTAGRVIAVPIDGVGCRRDPGVSPHLPFQLATFLVASMLGGNPFVGAFAGGVSFGATASTDAAPSIELTELLAKLFSFALWFIFGASFVFPAFESLDLRTVIYAALSLTVVRMLPVGLSLLASGVDRSTTAFIGWFGPRGLASVVFALLAVDELGSTNPHVVVAIEHHHGHDRLQHHGPRIQWTSARNGLRHFPTGHGARARSGSGADHGGRGLLDEPWASPPHLRPSRAGSTRRRGGSSRR